MRKLRLRGPGIMPQALQPAKSRCSSLMDALYHANLRILKGFFFALSFRKAETVSSLELLYIRCIDPDRHKITWHIYSFLSVFLFFGASFLCNKFKLTYHLIRLSINQFWCLSPSLFFPVYALPGFKDGKWEGRMYSTDRGMAFKSSRVHYVHFKRTLWSSSMVGIKEKHTVLLAPSLSGAHSNV